MSAHPQSLWPWLLLYALLPACANTAAFDPGDTLEDYTDQQIDAGFAAPVFNADDPLLQQRKVFIHHDINSRTAADVMMRLMYLDGVDSRRAIDLYVSTQGGWNDNAFAIIDAMRLIGAPVNTWAIGGCYSAGTLIVAAGTGTRYATGNAMLMVHASGENEAAGDSYSGFDRARYARTFRQVARLPESWFPLTDGAEHYLDAEAARRLGLIDQIAGSPP